jgi:hypothetical protein
MAIVGIRPYLKWVIRWRSLPAENRSMSAMPPIATKFCRVAECRDGSQATEPSGRQRVPMSAIPPTATKQRNVAKGQQETNGSAAKTYAIRSSGRAMPDNDSGMVMPSEIDNQFNRGSLDG